MRLKIRHKTEYAYDAPVAYALQRLRLYPRSSAVQKVDSWTIGIEGAREQVRFVDHLGNDTRLVSVEGEPHTIVLTAEGEVETFGRDGVSGPHRGFAPLWLFLRETGLTGAGPRVEALIGGLQGGEALDRLHRLMAAIGERVAYTLGATDAQTSAEEALANGSGVCQDHAHIFIAAARRMGFPARYVSGYLKLDDTDEQAASHAWAEAHVDHLGWVAFDCSNGISPDERYVRLAVGCDYRDAMPISGIRHGSAEERLAVRITVEQ
ncbi:transglutaminase family protein [Aquibium sp. A9E412]|uniref:transglutaminase family protein n=1 Tax=Aquibium sp. A9E412 TaxID=2976767 RepID=UPI0025AEE295|nr:transglutaminase family protein [Aquibium sp. A9E412]MDN2568157.1 transglutaminase family protein [Aquibium sp. A9E412]